MSKTIIIGASEYTHRYSNMAAHMLSDHKIDFEMVGKKGGELLGKTIHKIKDKPEFNQIHTITLYINPDNQKEIYNYIINLAPQRIIFNPGTENYELSKLAQNENINVVEACTLVMLQTGQF